MPIAARAMRKLPASRAGLLPAQRESRARIFGCEITRKMNTGKASRPVTRRGVRRQVSWLFQVNSQRPRSTPGKAGCAAATGSRVGGDEGKVEVTELMS